MKKLKALALSLGLMQALSGANAFAQSTATWTVTGSWGANYYARSGDFNGDGYTDIASPSGADGRMKLNTAGSGFTSTSWVIDGGSTTWPGDSRDVLVGDFDCNGRADFLHARTGNAQFITIKFAGTNTFTTQQWPLDEIPATVPNFDGPIWGAVGFVQVGDFDGDGCRDDIVSPGVNGTTSHTHAYFGQNTPSLHTDDRFIFAESTANATAGAAEWTFVGDFNNDGKDDIASANGSNVYMSLGGTITCSFPCGANYVFGWSTGTWTAAGSWGAQNYGRSAQYSSGASNIFSPTGATMIKKTPSGTSFTTASNSTSGSWGQYQWTFIGDFDGDGGEDDFASANGSSVYMKFN